MNALLKPRQAAKVLGIGYNATMTLIREGKLRTVRLPNRQQVLVDEVDIQALIEASKAGPVSGPIEEIRPVEKREIVAPIVRGQRQTEKRNLDWMQRYGRK